MSLVKARAKAADARALVTSGVDPIEQMNAQRVAARAPVAASGPTFEEEADAYMADKLKRLRNEVHQHQWQQTLRDYAYPIIGHVPVAEIGTSHVLDVLRPIWETKCETASRLRGRIERILARAKGHASAAVNFWAQSENQAQRLYWDAWSHLRRAAIFNYMIEQHRFSMRPPSASL